MIQNDLENHIIKESHYIIIQNINMQNNFIKQLKNYIMLCTF